MSSIKKTKSKATFPYYWTNLIMYVTVALISTKYIISINDMNIIVLNVIFWCIVRSLFLCGRRDIYSCMELFLHYRRKLPHHTLFSHKPLIPWFPIITGCPCITLEPAVSWPDCHSVYWIKRRNVNRKIAPWDWLPSYHSFELR